MELEYLFDNWDKISRTENLAGYVDLPEEVDSGKSGIAKGRKDFRGWLESEEFDSETVDEFVASINYISSYIRQVGYSTRHLYDVRNFETLKSMYKRLSENNAFKDYDSKMGNRYLDAFDLYLEFYAESNDIPYSGDPSDDKLSEKSEQGPVWGLYDSTILLDGCMKYAKQEETLLDAIQYVSESLRKMAERDGRKIGTDYCNGTYVWRHMKLMIGAYLNKPIEYPLIFRNVSSIYRSNRPLFLESLSYAITGSVNANNGKPESVSVKTKKPEEVAVREKMPVSVDNFKAWMEKSGNRHAEEYAVSLVRIKEFAQDKGIVPYEFDPFETDDPKIMGEFVDDLKLSSEFKELNAGVSYAYAFVLDQYIKYLESLPKPESPVNLKDGSGWEWDLYESVILLDGVLAWLDGKKHYDVVEDISEKLRHMGMNKGRRVDESYRSRADVSMQMRNMREIHDKKPVEGCKIFKETYDIYETDRSRFNMLLRRANSECVTPGKEAAKGLVDDKNSGTNKNTGSKQKFVEWLNDRHVGFSVPAYIECLERVSQYAVRHNLSKDGIWQISDNKAFNKMRNGIFSDRTFRKKNEDDYAMFEKSGKLYSDFLKFGGAADNFKGGSEMSPTGHVGVNEENRLLDAAPADKNQGWVEHILNIDKPDPILLNDSAPVSISYRGTEYDTETWSDAYVVFLRCVYEDFPEVIDKLCRRVVPEASYVHIYTRSNGLSAYRRIGESPYYLNTALSAEAICRRISMVASLCAIDNREVEVRYTCKSEREGESHVRGTNYELDTATDINTEQGEDGDKNKKQPVWDIYEAAILLDGVIRRSNGEKRMDIVCDISGKLRQRAINRGISINREYRNINGIEFQMSFMETKFFDKPYKTIHASKLFDEIINIYRNDNNRYEEILSEGLKSCGVNVLKDGSIGSVHPAYVRDDGFDEETCEALKKILTEKFRYGFKPESPLDMSRLMEYSKELGIVLPADERSVKSKIGSLGVCVGDSVYVVDSGVSSELTMKLRELFNKGYSLIYLEKFITRNYEWLSQNELLNEELIKAMIAESIENVYAAKGFFLYGTRKSEENAVLYEIRNAWGENVTRSFEDLYTALPYITEEKIRYFLSKSHDFIRTEEGVYAYMDRFVITEERLRDINEMVDMACEKKGYMAINDIPIEDIELDNYEFTESAIYDALYKKFLSDRYNLRSRVLTRRDDTTKSLDANRIVREYCTDKSEVTLDELCDHFYEITGSSNRQAVLNAAYGVMVRRGEESFVSTDSVDFDVDKIDSLLDEYVIGEFVPVRDIVSFALFPSTGQGWNHFLLESFCYRFSDRFSLKVYNGNFNDKNVGIIIRKGVNYNYIEMLAMAVAAAGIRLSEEEVGQYLFENGYTSRSRYDWLSDVIKIARKTNEGKQ